MQRVFYRIADPKMQTGINIAFHFVGFGAYIRVVTRDRLNFHMAGKLFHRFGIVLVSWLTGKTVRGRWYVL